MASGARRGLLAWKWTFLSVLAICAGTASASDTAGHPLWEFGLGVGAIGLTDYRGSDTAHVYPLPVPYFVYRGKIFKSDRDGVRGLFLQHPRVELNLSVDATTPVSSKNNSARAGMPSLKPTIEFGPSLDVHLWRSDDERLRIDLRLPVRKAFSIETHPQSVGWFVAPRINIDARDVAGHAGWDLGMFVAPLFADRAYHEYFYTVAPAYATATRPAYRASGGYGGTEMLVAVSKRYPRFWVGAFARYDTLTSAVFKDSPLVRSRSYWAAGFGIAWMIAKSNQQVADDSD
jgi:outer membrane scaffolding protein for murein synthesis (MipA/OmpV family)